MTAENHISYEEAYWNGENSREHDMPDRERRNMLKWFQEFIEQDNHNLDFNVISWYIDRDPIGWFADWKYKLDTYSITAIDQEKWIYNLEMDFRLRKWNLTHTHTENIQLYYRNWNRLVIHHDWKFYKIEIKNKTTLNRSRNRNRNWVEVSSYEKWETLTINLWKKIQFTIKFKTD